MLTWQNMGGESEGMTDPPNHPHPQPMTFEQNFWPWVIVSNREKGGKMLREAKKKKDLRARMSRFTLKQMELQISVRGTGQVIKVGRETDHYVCVCLSNILWPTLKKSAAQYGRTRKSLILQVSGCKPK